MPVPILPFNKWIIVSQFEMACSSSRSSSNEESSLKRLSSLTAPPPASSSVELGGRKVGAPDTTSWTLNGDFLPPVVVGLRLSRASPC